MNFRTLIAHILDAVFPAKRKKKRSWATMTPERFEDIATKATQDGVLSAASAIALFSYNDPLVKDAMHALKYEGEKTIAALFGTILAEHVREELSDHALLSDSLPILIPIPVTFGRHIERSYNQTELIGEEVARQMQGRLDYAPGILSRSEFHGSQTQAKTRRERSSNIRGAFRVTHPEDIIGRDIILLDDVITTGATTHEATATLLAAGARTVSCIAVAH